MDKKPKSATYEHAKIETKWQKFWRTEKIYRTDDKSKKPKAYVLDMFPYPSGDGLHVGHPKGYIATDIYSRYKRMTGHNVLHPMGWDAFGLPAENYAIKNKIHPELAVKKNIKRFKAQLEKIGFDYDWSREVNTTDPKYYRWTQWIFLQLYKQGLAYESNEPINWCPSCQTGLANEDLEDGKCERCGSAIEKKPIRQWMLKITDYAERLLLDLELLNWPESVKESQRHWIGRSEGAEISFPLASKQRYVFLHGWKSSAERAFFPWLKKELEQRGHEVVAINLPNPYLPDPKEQADFVLERVSFDKNTIIVAHSLGSVVSYRILEKIKEPIRKLVIVAGLIEPKFQNKERLEAKYLIDWKFDLLKIKKRVAEIIILEDTEDPVIAHDQAKSIQERIGGKIFSYQAKQSHFCGAEELGILEHCLEQVKVFTTRPDTIFGATYLVLAPEHPLLNTHKDLIKNRVALDSYLRRARKKSELERSAENKEKTGLPIAGLLARNPANGVEIPIWVGDYVLPDYGTGAIMAVPAHDERDRQFARKYKLPIKYVIQEDLPTLLKNPGHAYTGQGKLINSGTFSGLDNEEAKNLIIQNLKACPIVKYKLRDWVFSRQRYWGEPIPLIHCQACGVVPVPETELPVKLPKVKSYAPTGTGESPLALIEKWVKVRCPHCGLWAKRETNTMPQWAGSSWYYLRYTDPQNNKVLFDPKKENYWSPIDLYVGGTEHATRHLIYARFWHKFLFDLGLVKETEPFAQLKNQGMILGSDNRKMSKRWGNVINPDDIVRDYGADTLRVYEMFMGPFEQGASWSTDNLMGARRFIEKIWRLATRVKAQGKLSAEADTLLHKTIKQVSADIENFNYNTAISALMIFSNTLDKEEGISPADWRSFLQILAPFAPHLSEELWLKLGQKKSIHLSLWPKHDEAKIQTEAVNIAIQINGKTRVILKTDRNKPEKEILRLAQKEDVVAKWLKGQRIKKSIYVPNRLLNIILV